MAKKPTVYCYTGCGTCKKALAWLKERGIDFDLRSIRETPPTKTHLKKALAQLGTPRLLLNTSSGDYKELGLKDELATMKSAELIELLASRGNLIKRPFVILPQGYLVGFKPADYEEALG
jgi:arsenate reductase